MSLPAIIACRQWTHREQAANVDREYSPCMKECSYRVRPGYRCLHNRKTRCSGLAIHLRASLCDHLCVVIVVEDVVAPCVACSVQIRYGREALVDLDRELCSTASLVTRARARAFNKALQDRPTTDWQKHEHDDMTTASWRTIYIAWGPGRRMRMPAGNTRARDRVMC